MPTVESDKLDRIAIDRISWKSPLIIPFPGSERKDPLNLILFHGDERGRGRRRFRRRTRFPY